MTKLYMVGLDYELKKGSRGGDRKSEEAKSKGQNVLIANEYTRRHLKRANLFYHNVNRIQSLLGLQTKNDILSGNCRFNQSSNQGVRLIYLWYYPTPHRVKKASKKIIPPMSF